MVNDEVDPLDAYMATLMQDDGTVLTTTAAVRTYRGRVTTATTDQVVRNRRYTRLQQLLAETTVAVAYFSDEMMQQRSPALFHLHLGQYLNVASRQQRAPGGADSVSLSAFLLDTCDRQVLEARRVAEQQTWGQYRSVDDEKEEEEEEEEDEDEEAKDGDVSLDERRNYLIQLMSQRFLDGADTDFVDYATIDNDEALDDMAQIQRDAEDRYFDMDD